MLDYYGGDDGSGTADQFGNPLGVGPTLPTTGGMSAADMVAAYRSFLAQGMSEEDAINAAKAQNGGQLGVLNPGTPIHTDTTNNLPWIPAGGNGDVQPAVEINSSGGGGYVGGGGNTAPGGGITNPALYAPFSGQAPSYHQPTLPSAPSFDDYYNAGNYPTPVYTAPQRREAPRFEAGTFRAPTIDEAQNQPGYQFGVQQGEKALQQSRAAQGLLRTGGTLKDILDYGRNAATQNYGNVFNQNLDVFKANEGGRVNAYNTNYQTQINDPNQYDLLNAQTSFQGQLQGNRQALDVAQARFAPQILQYQTDSANAQRQSELGYNSDWQKYLDSENVFYNNQNGPFTKYLSLAQLGAANA